MPCWLKVVLQVLGLVAKDLPEVLEATKGGKK